jgi:ribonucleoside-diphosphate reductase alpha chain
MLVKSAAAGSGTWPAHTQESQKPNRSAIRQTSRVIKDERPGLTFERYFTRTGVDPFDTVEWESRDAVISGADG